MIQSKWILIIDDNEDDIEFISEGFKKYNHLLEIKSITSGTEALHNLKRIFDGDEYEDIPSFILLDINMPGMNGFEVIQKMKNDQYLKIIPVVFFTTSNRIEDSKASFEAGAAGYIQKPSGIKEMEKVARNIYDYWISINILPGISI